MPCKNPSNRGLIRSGSDLVKEFFRSPDPDTLDQEKYSTPRQLILGIYE